MNSTPYDVAVIGAGPGGYVAAIRASQLGLRAALIDRRFLGGVCLNIGCIPTKALLHTADLLEEARAGKRFGVVADNVTLDWAAVLKYKEQVVRQVTGGVGTLMKKNKIDVHMGTATIIDRGRIQVAENEGGTSEIQAKNIIICTGARPRDLPQIGAAIDEDRILSSTGALELKEIPKSFVIVGAGAIGVEFASMYRSFGSEVTLVELLPRIVPGEDEEISAELARAFRGRGIKMLTGARLERVERTDAGLSITVTDSEGKQQQLSADRMLLGVGIIPNTDKLGLDELGVTRDQRGFIQVDGMMQTNVPGIYAIGDCVPTPWLAHVASAEGQIAAEHIAGRDPHPLNYDFVPACTYCTPEVASAGLTEAEARERGHEVKVGRFPFAANAKASILGQRSGLIKIVTDAQFDQVLGVHMIGAGVTELIAEAGLALTHEATAQSLMHTIHAHPTLYESMGEAAHAAAEGAAIHV